MAKLQVVVSEDVKEQWEQQAEEMGMSVSGVLRDFLSHTGYACELLSTIDIIVSEAHHGRIPCSIMDDDIDWREYAHQQLNGLIDEAIQFGS